MFCGIYVITPMNIVRCTMYNMMYLKSAPLLSNPVFQSYCSDRCTEALLSILYKHDDTLMLVFCQALVDTGQAHVTRMLGFKH